MTDTDNDVQIVAKLLVPILVMRVRVFKIRGKKSEEFKVYSKIEWLRFLLVFDYVDRPLYKSLLLQQNKDNDNASQ